MRMVQRNGWVIGLLFLLALLLAGTKIIQPDFGITGLESLGRAAVPFAFATAAMAVVVIAGGIDLSVAAMMAVASVTAARLMVGAGDGETVLIVIGVLALGAGMGALNGALIVLTRVPDIVATLAMLFVWEGVALLILNTPSGDATQWLRDLILGNIGGIIPKSLFFTIICLAPIWLLLKRTQLGLAIYAIGSDSTAAFRSGVPTQQTRIAAYCIAGILAAIGGLTLTMSTGIGEPIPGPYLLAAVSAVVLGGVALTGGKGGLVGPVVAVLILRTVRLDLTLLSIDPNVTTIVEGTIMVVVVMLGGLVALQGRKS